MYLDTFLSYFEFLIFMVLFCIGFPVFSLCLFFFFYHVLIYLCFWGYVLLVFVKHYIMFSCIIWCSCWEYFFILCILSVYYGFLGVYFECIMHSVYLSFLCLSKLGVFIFSLSFIFWVIFFCIVHMYVFFFISQE